MTEEEQMKLIKENPFNIKNIVEPTERVQLAAISNNRGYLIQGIANPTKKVRMKAIRSNPYSIHMISNPTSDELLLAFLHRSNIIEDFQYISEEHQKVIVLNNPSNIKYIKYPSEEAKLLASYFE